MGFDGLGLAAARRLPDRGRESFLNIIQHCEARCTLPRQCSVTRCALAGKHKGDDRVLGMIPLVPKVWCARLERP
eukprot:9259048-Pyramimonas_sp.AAC.1